MTKIKICGFTQEKEVYHAIDAGIDSVGFVFYEKSKRHITAKQISWINKLPAFVQITGLFVNPSYHEIKNICENLPIDLLQFHGNETADFCEQTGQQLRKRYIKAVPMQTLTKASVIQYIEQYTHASGFLLDNYGQTEIGGSGSSFDWSDIPTSTHSPMILAGGINIDNIKHILSTYKPYAIDLSSSVENAPGIKSKEKMIEFISIVKNYDSQVLKST